MKQYYDICEYVDSENERYSYVVELEDSQLEIMQSKIEKHNAEYMDVSKITIIPYQYAYLGRLAMDMINYYANNDWRQRIGLYSLVKNWESLDMYKGNIFKSESAKQILEIL